MDGMDEVTSCTRCGQSIMTNAIIKRQDRGDYNKDCKDCRTTEAKKVQYGTGQEYCIPHKGLFDEDDNPLDRQGKLYKPGIRSCGHRDCIRPMHIIKDPAPQSLPITLELYDISYRTGVKLSAEQMMERIRGEAIA